MRAAAAADWSQLKLWREHRESIPVALGASLFDNAEIRVCGEEGDGIGGATACCRRAVVRESAIDHFH